MLYYRYTLCYKCYIFYTFFLFQNSSGIFYKYFDINLNFSIYILFHAKVTLENLLCCPCEVELISIFLNILNINMNINENDTVVQSKKKYSLIEDNVNISFFYLFRFNKISLKFDITVALILISFLLMNLIIKPEK